MLNRMDQETICQNIKDHRRQRKMTLDELAGSTGLSKGYLSKIERANKLPPFSTLNKIAEALGVETASLFAKNSEPLPDPRIAVVRSDEGCSVSSDGALYGYQYETLGHGKKGKHMEPYIIEPAVDELAVFQHEGEEFMYTLEGTHELTYDGQKYILNKGDSVYFDASVPHSGRSLGKKRARILAVMFSPRRK